MKGRRRADDDGSTPQSDACVLSARLGELLSAEANDFFLRWGLTLPQFNVMRILYVRDPERRGIPRGAVEARLIKRGPDVTRLIDRLEAAGMVERLRGEEDRRSVLTRLTGRGIALVEETHEPLLDLNRRQFAHMSPDEVRQLIGLVRKAMDRPRMEPAADAGD